MSRYSIKPILTSIFHMGQPVRGLAALATRFEFLKDLGIKSRGALLVVIIAVYGVAFLVTPAQAQETQARPNTLSFGVGVTPEFDGSDDFRVIPLIAGRYSAFGVTIDSTGNGINVDLLSHPTWRAGPSVGFSLARNDNSDNAIIRALPGVDTSIEIGGFIGFETPVGGLPQGVIAADITARQDVAGGHDGFLVSANVAYMFAATDRLRLSLGGGATFANQDYFDAFFSVSPAAAAASGLNTFDADAGLKDVGANVTAFWSLSPRLGLFVTGGYRRLLRDAADSPIVTFAGDADQVTAGGGLSVTF